MTNSYMSFSILKPYCPSSKLQHNYTATADVMGCPDIPDPSHGNIYFNVDKTAPFDIGTTATYHCFYGYHPVGGSLVRVCESGESDSENFWNGTAPFCQGKLQLCTNRQGIPGMTHVSLDPESRQE